MSIAKLENFMKASTGDWPPIDVYGTESPWLVIGDLAITSGWLWTGDPMVLSRDDGVAIEVPTGNYTIEGKALDFAGHRRISRVRAFLTDVENPTLGIEVSRMGTECAVATIADIGEIEQAIEESGATEFDEGLWDVINKVCGVAHLALSDQMISFGFVQSGLGDGNYPVYLLKEKTEVVGLEVQFMAKDFSLQR
jgi:hypothetical protein